MSQVFFGIGCTKNVEQWEIRSTLDQEVMDKCRMAEVLEWETASVALREGSQRVVQPRDGRPKQHPKQDNNNVLVVPATSG